MAATFTPINTTTLGSASNLVTFTSISQSYDDLFITIGSSITSINNCAIALYFNNDNTSAYGRVGYRSDGSGSGSSSGQAAYENANTSGTSNYLGLNSSQTGTNPAQYNIYIANYSSTTINKTMLNRSGTGIGYFELSGSVWRSTSAINRIDIKAQNAETMSAGTVITIWGIKAA